MNTRARHRAAEIARDLQTLPEVGPRYPEPNFTTSCTVCGHIAAHITDDCATGCGYCLRSVRSAREAFEDAEAAATIGSLRARLAGGCLPGPDRDYPSMDEHIEALRDADDFVWPLFEEGDPEPDRIEYLSWDRYEVQA
jgi:ribosomal protein L37E